MSPIASRAKKCAGLFEDLVELLRQPDHQACEISDTEATDAFGRFKIWAGNIGAFQQIDLKSSLDYRLRDAAKISTQILENLDDLTESLEDACSIVSNVRDNRKGPSLIRVEQSEDEEQEETEELSEIREIFESIQDAINSLFRYSIIIRNNTNRDRYAKAAASAIDSPFSDEYDIQHVRHKFPALQSKNQEWLIERLGKAITQRRQYLRYCLSHHEKMGQESASRAAPDIVRSDENKLQVPARFMPISQSDFSKPTSTLAPTQASTLLLTAGQVIEEEAAEETPSQTSYATSTDEENNSNALRVIPLEDISKGLGHFECPYCWQIQTCRTQKAWKKHVLLDLKPYVCTFEDCELKLFSDRQTWFSHELKDHRKEWICHFCVHNPFNKPGSYHAHLSTHHPQAFTADQLPALFEMSQKLLLKLSPTDCPFCDDWEDRLRAVNNHIPKETSLVVTPSQFQHHVGAHMVQLALFAIPRGYTEEGEADSAVAAPHIDSGDSSLSDDPPDFVAEQFRKCENILDELIELAKDAPEYQDLLQFPAFSLGIPGLGMVNVSPIYLAMISQKLQSGYYSSANDFFRDLMLFRALWRVRWPFSNPRTDAFETAWYRFHAESGGIPDDIMISALSQEIGWRLWKAYQLASRSAGSPGEVCLLEIRLQGGESISRGFLKSADFEDIYAFVECYELILGGSPLPEVHKPLENVHGYNFRLIDTNPSVPTGALDLRDCTVGDIVEKYGIREFIAVDLQDGEPPQRLSKNGESLMTRQTTMERRSSPEMERSPAGTHPTSANELATVIEELIGNGLDEEEWKHEIEARGWVYNTYIRNAIISQEFVHFIPEIRRLLAEPNIAQDSSKINSRTSIFKRIRGEEWTKGVPDERAERLRNRMLYGKVTKLRTFHESIRKFIDETVALERCQDLQAQAEILPEAGPSRKAIDEPPMEAGPSKQQELESPLYTPSPISATITRYYAAENKFWFVIHAGMEDGKIRELSRSYEDFYEFHIALMTRFPAEAGSTGTQKRTLPYMPEPVHETTDAIAKARIHGLDNYVKDLLAQPPYILRCTFVKQFFAPREGDDEIQRSIELFDADEWDMSAVLSWLRANGFSNFWQSLFESDGLHGAAFLELGNYPRAGSPDPLSILSRRISNLTALSYGEEVERLRSMIREISRKGYSGKSVPVLATKCKVLKDYYRKDFSEVDLMEGQVVTLVDQGDQDWWRVQTAGAEGWVPRGNLKIQLDQSSPILSSQALPDDSNEDARSVASRYSMDSMTAQHPSIQQTPKNRRPREYRALDQHDQELEEQNLETHEVSLPPENVGNPRTVRRANSGLASSLAASFSPPFTMTSSSESL